jgi:hypothetical protein
MQKTEQLILSISLLQAYHGVLSFSLVVSQEHHIRLMGLVLEADLHGAGITAANLL